MVVGLVEECEPIPETHLHVCKVNVGGAEPLQICCGADNVHAGGKYPVALEGAQVYATAKDHVTIEGTMKIKKGKLRGYESCGMLCSGTELGLTEDLYPGAGYNGLLGYCREDAEIGADVKPLLQLDDWDLRYCHYRQQTGLREHLRYCQRSSGDPEQTREDSGTGLHRERRYQGTVSP